MAPTKDAQKLRRAAERKGKAEDQHNLACLLYHGREGLKQDRVAAAKWWCKAAAQQHACSQCELGKCYVDGEGVDQNHALAAQQGCRSRGRQRSREPRQPPPRRQGRGAERRSGGGVVGESRGGG
jgi:hypothetical protein